MIGQSRGGYLPLRFTIPLRSGGVRRDFLSFSNTISLVKGPLAKPPSSSAMSNHFRKHGKPHCRHWERRQANHRGIGMLSIGGVADPQMFTHILVGPN